MYEENIHLGRFSQEEIDRILHESSSIEDTGARINFLSGQFLGIEYGEHTLTGDKDTPEIFTINLQKVDCFTFLDYVEAMRLSDSYPAFVENLKKVRYRSGKVSFDYRNHFFTDWIKFRSDSVEYMTGKVGDKKTQRIQKRLNEKDDGSSLIPGIQPILREIVFIPSEALDDSIFDKLLTGDYIGIYSQSAGLDVSHVGILIKKETEINFRHASSHKNFRKVLDQDFKEYIAEKPGIIVLRGK